MDADLSFKVTIDGPSGVGKSTVARIVAKRLSALYVDTGAMYRAVALGADRAAIKADDEVALKDYLTKMKLDLDGERIVLNNVDLTEKIREPKASALASVYSCKKVVRARLAFIQRELAGSVKRVVMEGRDIGTVVLPGAEIKFFLTAAEDVRAARRYADEKNLQQESMEDIDSAMRERDMRDKSRKVSPLKKASDAISIDTADLNIDGVVDRMMELIDERVQGGDIHR